MFKTDFFSGNNEEEARQAYWEWIEKQPGITLLYEKTGDDQLDEYFPDIQGPYFLTPSYLALRSGYPFYVLRRVENEKSADFSWYLPSQEQKVYAAYLRDATPGRKRIQGKTLHEVRSKLADFLAGQAQKRFRMP